MHVLAVRGPSGVAPTTGVRAGGGAQRSPTEESPGCGHQRQPERGEGGDGESPGTEEQC